MNPTTLQKVLQELGANQLKSPGFWTLKRMRSGLVCRDGLAIRFEVLIIAEIEEALREVGYDEFYTYENKNPGNAPQRKVGEEFYVCVTQFSDGDLKELEGTGPSKLAAWCDLFLKYRGVK